MKQVLRSTGQKHRRLHLLPCLILIAFLVSVTACRTVAPFASVDFTQENWKSKSGQAVWRVNRDAPEIAGELLFSTNQEGRTVLQMTKTPFPIVVAQLQAQQWQIEFPTENRTYSGRGNPPQRLAWLHLAKALQGEPVVEPWNFQQTDAQNWRFENRKTGEVIEGFLQ